MYMLSSLSLARHAHIKELHVQLSIYGGVMLSLANFFSLLPWR